MCTFAQRYVLFHRENEKTITKTLSLVSLERDKLNLRILRALFLRSVPRRSLVKHLCQTLEAKLADTGDKKTQLAWWEPNSCQDDFVPSDLSGKQKIQILSSELMNLKIWLPRDRWKYCPNIMHDKGRRIREEIYRFLRCRHYGFHVAFLKLPKKPRWNWEFTQHLWTLDNILEGNLRSILLQLFIMNA